MLYIISNRCINLLMIGILGFILAFLPLSILNTLLHEYSHILAIKKMYKTTLSDFSAPLWYCIKPPNKSRGTVWHVESNYLEFIAKDTEKYSYQIKVIARSGALYTFILYSIVSLILTILLGIFKIGWIALLLGVFIGFLALALIGYYCAKRKSCDREVFRNPKAYKYPY